MNKQLSEYRRKRNPAKTPEPFESGRPKKSKSKNGGIYCVQLHAASRLHYDFRLEWKGALLSFAVPRGPSYFPGDKRLAIQVEDHPLSYADFEGTIPKGEYGGGTVMLWDEGTWQPDPGAEQAYREGNLKFTLYGQRLKGRWALVKIGDKGESKQNNWLLIKEKDEYAKKTAGISRFNKGIKSSLTMSQISGKGKAERGRNPFDSLEIELAKLVDKVPDSPDMLYEIKFDGYRITAFCEGDSVRLTTRGGLDYAEKYPEIAEALRVLSANRSMVLDGELVVLDRKGRSDFHALQTYLRSPDGKELVYMVFDLPALDGADLRELPLIERKAKLERLLENAPEGIRYSAHIVGKGQRFFEKAAENQLEGIIGKQPDSPYRGGRSGDWIKVKCRPRQEFVIGGYTRSEKRREGVSALLLGVYEGGRLIYCGRAGSGFKEKESIELEKRFAKLLTDKSPFAESVDLPKTDTVFWMKPQQVAEIEFAELIEGKKLRQASFKGLREDKKAKEVVLEKAEHSKSDSIPKKPGKKPASKGGRATAEVLGITISNPERIVYKQPQTTKLQVVEYYERVAERMMPFAGDRILSVVRCHKGVTGECFFKKHPAGEVEGTGVAEIESSNGQTDSYFYLRDKTGLIAQAQLGTIEFHVWGSRAKKVDSPDMMVFDLDPDDGMDISQIREGVRHLKKLLDSLSLQSFLKTSGGKGYHIVVPFSPASDWDSFHDFARGIAALMEEKWPDKYTSNMRKNKRSGRIFTDWVRNGRGATSVAPYSLRARPGAKVSMPIRWSELGSVAPDGIDMPEALRRLKRSDPWKDYFTVRQKLKPLRL